MTVFKFKFFYEIGNDAQYRFVIAETEEQAWDKINAYFDKLHSEGGATPVLICNPVVEIDDVI